MVLGNKISFFQTRNGSGYGEGHPVGTGEMPSFQASLLSAQDHRHETSPAEQWDANDAKRVKITHTFPGKGVE